MTLEQKELLRIIQGRIEGVACGVPDNVSGFLFDTAELIETMLAEEEEKDDSKRNSIRTA